MNDANKSRAGTTYRSNLQAASVPISQEYQQKATECLRLAHTANDLSNKALLLELAQAWLRLEHVPLKWNQPERHTRREGALK